MIDVHGITLYQQPKHAVSDIHLSGWGLYDWGEGEREGIIWQFLDTKCKFLIPVSFLGGSGVCVSGRWEILPFPSD